MKSVEMRSSRTNSGKRSGQHLLMSDACDGRTRTSPLVVDTSLV